MELDDVAEGAWAAHRAAVASRMGSVVVPSIPIAWFGDLEAYLRSALRVITVGLNPSRLEFPRADPFLRFPRARELAGNALDAQGRAAYAGAMNDYFREKPYSAWFRPSFEEFLLGMDASFYGSASSTALHTDLCSPIATDPTWSGLGEERQIILREEGVCLWHELARLLEPDVIVASVARRHLDQIRFEWDGAWRVVHTIDRQNPYLVEARNLLLGSNKRSTLVFGRAAQKPFATIGSADKRRAGAAVLKNHDS
jgi:hypothetical protein